MTAQVNSQHSVADDTAVTTESVLNQDVYSRTGKKVGRVADIVVDFDEQRIDGLLLTDVNRDLFTQDSVPKKFVIPYSWVQDSDSIVVTVPISAERVNFRNK